MPYSRMRSWKDQENKKESWNGGTCVCCAVSMMPHPSLICFYFLVSTDDIDFICRSMGQVLKLWLSLTLYISFICGSHHSIGQHIGGLHFVNWDTVTPPKREGSWLVKQTLTLNGKLGWNMVHNTDSDKPWVSIINGIHMTPSLVDLLLNTKCNTILVKRSLSVYR